MQIVDDSIENLRRAAQACGAEVENLSDPHRNVHPVINQIEEALAPFRLPAQLKRLWTSIDMSSIDGPGDWFFPPAEVLRTFGRGGYPERGVELPVVCIPLLSDRSDTVVVELESDDHFGGRVFSLRESVFHLQTTDVAEYLDVLVDTYRAGGVYFEDNGYHWMDAAAFGQSLQRHQEGMFAPASDWRFPELNRSEWPRHWQVAEGIPDGFYDLRGSTHSVAAFDAARVREPVVATLHGTYANRYGGGELDGSVGTFRDATGSVQVFVPHTTWKNGCPGVSGKCEIDVIGVPPNGLPVGELPNGCDFLAALESSTMEERQAALSEVFRSMRKITSQLDVSITVTAMRPVS